MLQTYLDLRPMPDYGDYKKLIHDRLDELVLNEALYQEALRLKLDQDPRVRFRMQQFLVQSLIEQIEGPAREEKVTDKQITKYYETHKDLYVRPEQRRVSEIFIAATARNQRREKRNLAQKVLNRALNLGQQSMSFGDLVEQYSDIPSRHRKGDTGYFDKTGKPIDLARSVVGAAFSLKKIGQVYDQVIESEQGFHIIKLVNYRVAQKKDLEDVKHQIKQEIVRDRVERAREAFFQDIKARTQISINEEFLARIIESVGEGSEQVKPSLPTSP
jgi:parvulin-like peptidyl-prolyl isomerase